MHQVASSACQRVADFWDSVTTDFLEGKPTNVRPPLDQWFTAYAGRGRGEVDLPAFLNPTSATSSAYREPRFWD